MSHLLGLWIQTWTEIAIRTSATCHPSRKSVSHGLCDMCYRRQPRIKERKRLHYFANKDKARLRSWRWTLKRYGINEEIYNKLYEAQGRVCAICKVSWDKKLWVDHDHETGQVRGLLCSGCNTLLGLAQEGTEILRTAIAYLERNNMPMDYSSIPHDPILPHNKVSPKGHGYGVNQGTYGPIEYANPLASYDGFQGIGLGINAEDEGLKRGWAPNVSSDQTPA